MRLIILLLLFSCATQKPVSTPPMFYRDTTFFPDSMIIHIEPVSGFCCMKDSVVYYKK